MSMKGMTIKPTMMKVGNITPACQGSKNTSISCRPRKYHGAFDGFGVRVGLAGSSSGASTSSDQTISRIIIAHAIRNSLRTRCGQVWILSSPGPVAFLIGTSIRLPGPGIAFNGVAMVSALLALGAPARRPEERDQNQHEDEWNGEDAATGEHEREDDEDRRADDALQLARHGSLERRAREAVAPDAPEVDGHEETRDQRDEDAVEDVEAEQRVWTDLAPAEEEGARVVDVVEARDQLVAGPLVAEDRRRAAHVGADGHRPDGQLVPRQQVAGEREQQRQHEQDHADHPVELARRLVRAGQEHAEHVQPDR